MEQETVADPEKPGEPAQIVSESVDQLDIVSSQRNTAAGRDDRPGESMENGGFPPGK